MSRHRPVAAIRLDLELAEASLDSARKIHNARIASSSPSEWERALLAAGVDASTADAICHRDARLPDLRALDRRILRLRTELARAEKGAL